MDTHVRGLMRREFSFVFTPVYLRHVDLELWNRLQQVSRQSEASEAIWRE
jgi:hypothetical protein